MQAIEIFIAYSHKDLAFKDELRTQLRPLVRAGRACIWDDYDIEAGREWDAVIKERLYGAQIILLLVSPDSLDSDYFYGKEVTTSLERHARGEAMVVPVILRACLWQQTPLGALEALPTKGRPVASWPARDDAWHAVAQSVSELVDSRQQALAAQTALEKQRQDFTAAVLAAEQLLEKQNWSEARTALADALQLHQPGFSPDAARLQQQLAECDRHLQAATAAQVRAAAGQQHLAEPSRRQAEAEKQRRREAASSAPNRWPLLGGLAIGALLVVALLVWRPWRNVNHKSATDPKPAVSTPATGSGDAAFQQLTIASTIPELQEFVQKYPQYARVGEVKNWLKSKELARNGYLNDAQLYIGDRNWAKARRYLQKVLALDPQNAEAIQNLEQIKGK